MAKKTIKKSKAGKSSILTEATIRYTIRITPSLKERIEREAVEGGHRSPVAYVRKILEENVPD